MLPGKYINYNKMSSSEQKKGKCSATHIKSTELLPLHRDFQYKNNLENPNDYCGPIRLTQLNLGERCWYAVYMKFISNGMLLLSPFF